MATWLDREEYPFVSKYFETHGHKLHYIDEGEGEVIVFVHGTPSWSFDFRHVIKMLKVHYRCIAFDHIGFGLSDKPAGYDYSTLRHSETLTRFVDHLKLAEITLVAHDFGGPIGLNFAIKNPHLVRRFVILNSWLWSSEDNPVFKRFTKVLRSPLLPLLYRYLNFSPRFVLPASFGKKKLSRKILGHYTGPFRNRKERNGTIAFARSLLSDQKWFESLWSRKSVIEHKPALFIWGMKDKYISGKYLERFSEGFPHSVVLKLKDCGHFPQEEEPELMGRAMLAFLRELSVKNDRAVTVNENPVAEHKL